MFISINIFILPQARLSTEREVVLDDVDFSTTGEYRCEVSGDAPMFQTATINGILFVVGMSKTASLADQYVLCLEFYHSIHLV